MTEINIFEDIMKNNKNIALQNKKLFKNSLVINFMSSPGSGKTTILEKILKHIDNKYKILVIEGDVSTSNDTKRIKKYKVKAVQIKTENYGGACHLDAKMINSVMKKINNNNYDLIIIENVGNLICPADFYLGEDKKAVVLSITEGEDKPLKYPLMFEIADLVLVNKIDLKDVLNVDIKKLNNNIKKINKRAKIINLSAKTEENIDKLIKQIDIWINKKRG